MRSRRLPAFGVTFVAALLALAVPRQDALAYSECALTVSSVLSVDQGNIWLYFTNGGATVILNGDPDKEATLSFELPPFLRTPP